MPNHVRPLCLLKSSTHGLPLNRPHVEAHPADWERRVIRAMGHDTASRKAQSPLVDLLTERGDPAVHHDQLCRLDPGTSFAS